MTKWIPEWLASTYQLIIRRFWLSPFTITQAEKVGVPRPRVVLPRLAASGWLERVGRGEYRAVHPLIAVLASFGAEWRSRVQQRAYLPLIELVLARLIDGLGERLRSVLLYGSVARGKAEKDSDIDLLIIADNLPDSYSDRVRLILDLIRGWEDVKASLSRRYGINPNPDIIVLDSREVDPAQPFFLDLAFEGIVLHDRDDFLSSRLQSLRRELQEMGAVRITLPDGRWYWSLPTGAAP